MDELERWAARVVASMDADGRVPCDLPAPVGPWRGRRIRMWVVPCRRRAN